MRRRWLRWAIPAAVLPVLALLAYGFWTNPREIPSPLLGRAAAPFSLTTFDRAPLALEDLRDEAPALERTWQAYKDKGVMVVGVNVQDTEEPARKFLARFGHSFPNAPDPKGHVAVDYGVYGVPETFFIDRRGRVRFKHVGALTDEAARQRLESLLEEPS